MKPAESVPMLIERPRGAVTTWVIYERPRDFPEGCVLRAQFAVRKQKGLERFGTITEDWGSSVTLASRFAWYAATVDELRAILPPGVTNMTLPGEDNAIAEVWME